MATWKDSAWEHRPKILLASSVAKENGLQAKRLQERFEDLERRCKQLDRDLGQSVQTAFDTSLSPFATNFARLKNVEIDDPELLDRVPKVKRLDVHAQKVSLGAVKGLVVAAGGVGAGAGAGAVTFAAVGALATASTGTAISTLSGAAATSATLAWLGGGAVAAGGGGMAVGTVVLASVVAVPAVLAVAGFTSWQGRKQLAKQRQAAAELRGAAAALERQEHVVAGIDSRVSEVDSVLRELTRRMAPLNGWLEATLRVRDDYRTFSTEDRNMLALLVSLAVAMSAVMSTPIMVSPTEFNPRLKDMLAEARAAAA